MKKFGAIGLLILTFTTTNSSAYDRHHKLAEEDDCSISDSYKVVEIGEKIYQKLETSGRIWKIEDRSRHEFSKKEILHKPVNLVHNEFDHIGLGLVAGLGLGALPRAGALLPKSYSP